MKNILAKLGSKKIMGAVLVMVTLVVGLGVISNFSGSDPKRANEAALSKFNDNSYNNFYGSAASRSDLERQLSLGQDSNTARFFRGNAAGTDEDDAFSADGAYGEGVRSDEGFVYGDVNYGPGGAGYAAGAQAGATGVAGNIAGGAAGTAGAGADGSFDPSNPMTVRSGVRGSYDPLDPKYAQGAGIDGNGVPYGAAGVAGAAGAAGAASAAGARGEDGDVDENGVPRNGKGGKSGKGAGSAAGAAGGAAGDAAVGAAGGAGASDADIAAAEAAARAAKAKAARERANRIRRATQINKLASSGGGSSWGSMNAGGGGFGGGAAGAEDSARRPLPATAGAPQAGNGKVDPFKFGRGGEMGGYNVANGSGQGVNNRKDGDRSAINSLLYAHNTSAGANKKVSEGMKSMAEDAFIQGEDGSGNLIADGASIKNAISQLPESAVSPDGAGGGGGGIPGANLEEKRQKLEELQDEWKDLFWGMILKGFIIAAASWGLAFLGKLLLDSGVFWLQIVGIVLIVAAIATAILGILWLLQRVCGLGGECNEDSLIGIYNQMTSEELNPVNEGGLKGWQKPWLAWTMMGIMDAVMLTAVTLGILSSPSAGGALGTAASATISASGGLAISGGTASFLGTITGIFGGLASLFSVGQGIHDLAENEDEGSDEANGTGNGSGGNGGNGGGSGGGN